MALEPAHLRHLARLARLDLSDADLEAIRPRLRAIIEYVDQLKKLDVEGVPPLDNAVDLANVRRPDEPRPGLPAEAALGNAPAATGPYFAVPRIIDAP
ncbi:MAG TPA: Asp-tRNA(Asn)/Glu-tRNA(Gln) amidotransferase subunit GatC [Planctomycetota bacterium]|nr:Asp-tRNA(Asn)/Glu-tRNA(Gln) amidotransferase subunit GatC [Planctomycetota bacterium]